MLLDEDEEVLEDNYVFSKLNQQSKKRILKRYWCQQFYDRNGTSDHLPETVGLCSAVL